MRKSLIFLLFILSLIINLSSCQSKQPQHTILQLNKLLNKTNVPSGIQYYKIDLQLNKDSNKILMVTVEAGHKQYIGVYISLQYDGVDKFNKYPDYQNNANQCSYSSLDTCAVFLPQFKTEEYNNVIAYIGVQTFQTQFVTIIVSVENIYPAKVGHNYKIDFSDYQSAILSLDGQQIVQYQQVIVQMKYSEFQNFGRFALYAGIGVIPNDFSNRIQAKMLGAFNQILILEPPMDIQTYYIIIQGQKGSKFDLSIQTFSKSNPSLKMNNTLYYYSTQQTIFQNSIKFDSSSDYILPLFIDLTALGGYGQFKIDYCDSLTNYTFLSINGQNGEVSIPLIQRKKCRDYIMKQGGLLIENIIVKVTGIALRFSYSIGLFQGQYPLQISTYNQRLGTILAQQKSRTYTINGFINQSFILKYKTISGQDSLNFTIHECNVILGGIQKCKTILDSTKNSYIDTVAPDYYQFNFTTFQGKNYKLKITHFDNKAAIDSEYIILMFPENPKQYPLTPAKPVINIIQENEYQYYIINLTLIKAQSNLTITQKSQVLITLDQTNGDCILLTSLSRQRPQYDMLFQQDSDVDYSWSGRKSYYVDDQTQVIYVSILGAIESIYHLQVNIEVNQDVPEKYTKLIGDKLLKFTLTAENKVLMLTYTAHSIPYTIIMSPTPQCIQYGYSFPITNQQCRDLPTQLTQKTIYMKVSDSNLENDFKLSVYIYSGTNFLYQFSPVMIACISQCYQFVEVYLQKQSNIIHQGMGYVSKKNSDQMFDNTKMNLKCQTFYPCFVTVNASLPYGGQMQLFYDSDNVQQIQWLQKPLSFNSTQDYKYFFMRIRSYSSLNTAIFYTQGITVDIYYNIFAIKQNKTNALSYSYPNGFDYMGKVQGNPLRRYHIVEFDKNIIQKLGCKDENQLCIATLAVIPDTSLDYSKQYIESSIGYFSCNTFKYYMPINHGYSLSQEHSLIYFTHEFDDKDIIADAYYVKVQPLSSCRPQIYASFDLSNQQQQMPFYGSYKIDSKTQNISQSRQLNFMISTDSPCQYSVWLFDSDIKPVIDNVNYELFSDENGSVIFAFSDKYLYQNRQFTVKFDRIMSQIMINQYQKYPDGTINYPDSKNNLAYISQSKTLKYQNNKDNNNHFYVIKARTNINQKVNVQVQDSTYSTTLLGNDQTTYQFTQTSQKVSYLFYTNNDFQIFAITDSGSVKFTVTNFNRDDRTVLEQYINQNSDSWYKIKALNSDIQMYLITFENVALMKGQLRTLQQTRYPKIKIHIQESGTIGLAKLYEGVALFDAFYDADAENCYKYQSEAIVGRHELNIDIIFGSEFLNILPTVNYRISTSKQVGFSNNVTKLPTGYRVHSKFYSNQTYQICFSLDDTIDLVSKQFYIMIQNQAFSLKHITLDKQISSQNPSIYEIFQYIATQDQDLMIQVVNCYGKNTLLGSNHYSDIYIGQVSELDSYYKDQTLLIAKTTIKFGYYYFGIKINNFNDRYKIRVQLLKKNHKIHYNKFQLKHKQITKVKQIQENNKKFIKVQLPKINHIQNTNNQIKIGKITYNLFLDNIKNKQNYTSNTIAKCPNLADRKMEKYSFTHYQNQMLKEDSGDSVYINIPSDKVPQKFNLTGYAQIQIIEPQPQTLTYYYDSTAFVYNDSLQNKGVSNSTIFFMISLVVISAIILYFTYKRWRQRKIKTKVAFEMATYNHQQNADNISHSDTNSPSKSIRKALNQNTGYGQFVDQSV